MTEQELRKELTKIIARNSDNPESTVEEIVKLLDKNESILPVCQRCEKDVEEVFMCELCELMICDKCQANYNKFTEIDYNCCKRCANNNTQD